MSSTTARTHTYLYCVRQSFSLQSSVDEAAIRASVLIQLGRENALRNVHTTTCPPHERGEALCDVNGIVVEGKPMGSLQRRCGCVLTAAVRCPEMKSASDSWTFGTQLWAATQLERHSITNGNANLTTTDLSTEIRDHNGYFEPDGESAELVGEGGGDFKPEDKSSMTHLEKEIVVGSMFLPQATAVGVAALQRVQLVKKSVYFVQSRELLIGEKLFKAVLVP